MNTPPSLAVFFPLCRIFFYLLCLLLSDLLDLSFSSSFFSFSFCFVFFLAFILFHQSQSLDQVALTNATILDGSGGGPNGSLAGSVGSMAVCLPSESSLTDSLHTSAVSVQKKDRCWKLKQEYF